MSRACLALSETLFARGIEVDPQAFAATYAGALHRYYAHREASLREGTTVALLRKLLDEQDLTVSAEDIRAALEAHYTVTRSNWRPAADALVTMRTLRGIGLKLGLLSNAGDDDDVRILARDCAFEPFLDFIVTSAQVGFRKPDQRAFQAALAHWDVPPAEIAMVGDRLDADIGGAKRSGLRAIWITANPIELGPDGPLPDATIRNLNELRAALARLDSRPE
jgi:putative hydrolase of the HAD superfamily